MRSTSRPLADGGHSTWIVGLGHAAAFADQSLARRRSLPTAATGSRPGVLVVFDDELVATHFLRVAREEMEPRGFEVPLWVSHKRPLDREGPLGRAWLVRGGPGARLRAAGHMNAIARLISG